MNPLTQFKKISVVPLVSALALVALAAAGVARADAVTDWNLIASNAIVVTAGQPPPVSVLHFAMVHGAVYDAVNAIDRGHRPYLVQPPSNPTDSKEAAAATAAFRVLVGIFPGQLGTLQPLYDAYIAGLPDNPPGSKAAGIAIGEATAAAMLQARMNDGRFGPPPALYPPAPGIWRPTPPNFANDPAPWVGNVRPFIVPSAEMLRTDGPNALTSARIRGGLQRDQGGRLTHQHNANRGPDRCCDLLAGPSDGALEPDLSHAGRQPELGHRRQRSLLRDGEPGCG